MNDTPEFVREPDEKVIARLERELTTVTAERDAANKRLGQEPSAPKTWTIMFDELVERKAEITRLKEDRQKYHDWWMNKTIERNDLTARLAEAQKDTERLDWLLKNDAIVRRWDDHWRVVMRHTGAIAGRGESPRIAIDAARTKEP